MRAFAWPRSLRDSHPHIGVVVLSQYADAAYALALLERGSGRRAYLLKERVSEPDQLVRAICEVARGGSMIDPAVVDGLVAARSRSGRSALSDLTPAGGRGTGPDGSGQEQCRHWRRSLPERARGGEAQVTAPVAWSTLALTVSADGGSWWELVGASPFPRHRIYDHAGRVVAKTGLVDFTRWYRTAFGRHTPWGGRESPALVAMAASALERRISQELLGGTGTPTTRRIAPGEALVTQGEAGGDLLLLLDGVLSVEVDGEVVAEVGPGAMLGERAILEGGRRTATLRAVTRCRAAVIEPHRVSREVLAELAGDHRRESAG